MKMLKNQEKGRTLVEMMGVISIISLLSITSIGGYNYLTSKWKISGLEDALLKMVLVVDGSQVKTIKALDRFLVQSMKGFDASAAISVTGCLSRKSKPKQGGKKYERFSEACRNGTSRTEST